MASRYQVVLEKRQALIAEAETLFAKAEKEARALTETERARDDAITAELKEYDEELARWQRQHDREKAQAAAKIADGAIHDPTDREFRSLGEFLQAVACATAPGVALQFGARAPILQQKLAAYHAASGMSVGSPGDGGHLVRMDWSTALLGKAREASLLLGRVRRIPVGGDFDGLEYPYIDEVSRATGSRWGGVRIYRKAEAATATASSPKIGKGELRLEETMGLAYATERLIRDAAALQGILTDAFASEFGFVADDELIRGTGSGQCLGVLLSPALVTQAAEGGQAVDTWVPANAQKMYARIPARLKGRAEWFIGSELWPQMFSWNQANMPVYMPSFNMAGAPFGTILGRPIVELEQCSAIGDLGDVLFAAWSEYVVIEKENEGIRFDTSMHVRFLFDEMAFRWVYRWNGQPIPRASLTPYKGANTQSPFVTLAAR